MECDKLRREVEGKDNNSDILPELKCKNLPTHLVLQKVNRSQIIDVYD